VFCENVSDTLGDATREIRDKVCSSFWLALDIDDFCCPVQADGAFAKLNNTKRQVDQTLIDGEAKILNASRDALRQLDVRSPCMDVSNLCGST